MLPNELEEKLRTRGLEGIGRYYGPYDAIVANVNDPEKRGRVQVVCPYLDANEDAALPMWFLPAAYVSGPRDSETPYGWFWPPEVGSIVLITFRFGDTSFPGYYFGGWTPETRVPEQLGYTSEEETPPVRRGFVTKSGHAFVFNEEADAESVELSWKKGEATSSLKFKVDGTVEILNKNGSQVLLDAENKKIVIEDKDNSNTITIDSNGVKIETSAKVAITGASEFSVDAASIKLGADGATQSAVLGDALVSWLNSHTHPTGVGPSGPASAGVPPLVSAQVLSTTVKVK